MGNLRVTVEGMPSITVDGASYPLFMSVLGFERWAEATDSDFESVLDQPVRPLALGLDKLRQLVRIMLECGEARRAMAVGGSVRAIGDDLIDRIFGLYHPVELVPAIIDGWSGSIEGEDVAAPPPTENQEG